MKLHVLIRDDLSPPWLTEATDVQRAVYKGVQGGHAVSEWMLLGDDRWQNHTLVYLKVKDERELKKWFKRLSDEGVTCAPFHEPDVGDEMTAFAVFGAGDALSKLPLL